MTNLKLHAIRLSASEMRDFRERVRRAQLALEAFRTTTPRPWSPDQLAERLELLEVFYSALSALMGEPPPLGFLLDLSDAKFEGGRIVATPGAVELLSPAEFVHAMDRHFHGDWGDCCAEDAERNDAALVEGTRLLSVYHTLERRRFWIITEADRSVTTVLLPDEY